MRIGFIGLGRMGAPMATNLVAAGHEVVVWNRTPAKAAAVAGAEIATRPADVVVGSDGLILMLPADEDVLDVLFGPNGIQGSLARGTWVVDCTTVSPHTSRRVADVLERSGVSFVDAPVGGSVKQAESGQLLFIVGGNDESVERVTEVLGCMGRAVRRMGGVGAGATAKLIINAMGAVALLAAAEGLALASASELDVEEFVELVRDSGAYSRMFDAKVDDMLTESPPVQFSIDLLHKDLRLALGLATETMVATPSVGLAQQVVRMCIGRGFGSDDIGRVYSVVREWSGQG